MNDYVLLFDESGQPYIAHAWLKKGQQPAYKMKVDNYYGPGKHLYLYTDSEVNAFRNKSKVKLSAKLKDKLGYDERIERNEARDKYNKALTEQRNSSNSPGLLKSEADRTQNAYSKTLLGRMEKITKKNSNVNIGTIRQNLQTQEEKEKQAKKNVKKDQVNVWLNQNILRPLQKAQDRKEDMLGNFTTVTGENAKPKETTSKNTYSTNGKGSPATITYEYGKKTIDLDYVKERNADIDNRLSKINKSELPNAQAEYSRALKELGMANKSHGQDSDESAKAKAKVDKWRSEVDGLKTEAEKLENEKKILKEKKQQLMLENENKAVVR